MFRVRGSAAFRELPTRAPIRASGVMLERCGDLHPFNPKPSFTATDVVLHECDKNFCSYWLWPDVFPHVQRIYLNSSPCDHYAGRGRRTSTWSTRGVATETVYIRTNKHTSPSSRSASTRPFSQALRWSRKLRHFT